MCFFFPNSSVFTVPRSRLSPHGLIAANGSPTSIPLQPVLRPPAGVVFTLHWCPLPGPLRLWSWWSWTPPVPPHAILPLTAPLCHSASPPTPQSRAAGSVWRKGLKPPPKLNQGPSTLILSPSNLPFSKTAFITKGNHRFIWSFV